MTKFKIFIVLTLLTLSVLLIPNLKSAEASTKQDYTLIAPPTSYEVSGEMFEILSIEYNITYYDTDNLYFLSNVVVKINDSVNTLTFNTNYSGYLPSDIKYIGLYFEPAYSNGTETVMTVDLYYRSSLGNGDNLLRDNFLTLNGLNHYLEDINCFYMYYTNISSQYNLGFNDGSKEAYSSGYNKGYQTGLETAENDFNSLFWGIADVPSQVLFSVLSFEIFGVNAFSILFSILTVLLIAWLIKRFIA